MRSPRVPHLLRELIPFYTSNRKIRMISRLRSDPLSREHHNRLDMQDIYLRKYLWGGKWIGTSLTLRERERKGKKEVQAEAF